MPGDFGPLSPGGEGQGEGGKLRRMDPIAQARKLRKNMTDAERKLWHFLRNRRLAGLKFRRQVPIGPYIVDFACIEKKVIVEIDGGEHNFPDHRQYDAQRTAYLEGQGFRVLRFWNNQVLSDIEAVLTVILQACQAR